MGFHYNLVKITPGSAYFVGNPVEIIFEKYFCPSYSLISPFSRKEEPHFILQLVEFQ